MAQIARTNPALLSQLQTNQRQQMLAQQLMEQGSTPMQTDEVAGHAPGSLVVPVSPFQGLAQVFESGLGGYEQKKADQQQGQLLAQALGGAQPSQSSSMSPEAMNGAAPKADDGSPIVWNAPQGDTNAPGQVTPLSSSQMDPGLIHKIAQALGVTDSNVSEGMMYNSAETLKAGMAALQNTPALAGARKGAEDDAILHNTTWTDAKGQTHEGLVTGRQIREGITPGSQPSPQISNSVTAPAPVPNAPQTTAGQSLPTVAPYQPMPNVQPGQNGLPAAADMNTMNAHTPINIPVPPPSPTGLPPTIAQSGAPSTSAVPQGTNVQGFGINPAVKAGEIAHATKTGDNSADTQKTLDVMSSNLPQVLNRLNEIKQASLRANFGYGVDNEGDGTQQKFAQQFLPEVDVANGILKTRAAQGILPELGPTLAQAGIKGNKFLETLSSNASGIDLAASVPSKINTAVNLENQYIKNYKATAAQARGQGQDAPTDEQIDSMVNAQRAQLPPIQIKDNGDFNVLPSGTTFVGPDGHVRVKS